MNIFEIINPNELNLDKLNSGHLCLELSSNVNWEQFPSFVEALLQSFGGTVDKKTDTADIRIWEVNMSGERIRVIFEDFPVMTSLESDTDSGDRLLQEIKDKLT